MPLVRITVSDETLSKMQQFEDTTDLPRGELVNMAVDAFDLTNTGEIVAAATRYWNEERKRRIDAVKARLSPPTE